VKTTLKATISSIVSTWSKLRHSEARPMPLLFSYGTLQDPEVQLSTFGRELRGEPDELVGFELSKQRIDDAEFVAKSGKALHSIVKFNGRDGSHVTGMVFEVSESELEQADRYEPAGYKRVKTRLASGKEAWVYAGNPQP
jgi:hypothetical protein